MWLSLALGIIVCAIVLYIPGFMLFRAIGFDALRSLLLGPIASALSYCGMGIAFARFGVTCSWTNVVLPVTVVFFALFLSRILWERKRAQETFCRLRSIDWTTLLLYVCVGILAGVYIYLMPLDNPQQFLQEYDNAFHMQVVRAFADSGNWSVLNVSKYMTAADASIAPLPGASFYPALWHLLCAIVMSVLRCSVPLAINAVNFVVASIVFSMGMLLFISSIFQKRRTVRFGALCTPAFVAFPWLMLYWGPLYSNVLAFALGPLAAALFVLCLDAIIEGSFEPRVLFAFILSTLTLTVAQTSVIFLCIVLLAPYGAYRLWTLDPNPQLRGHSVSGRLLSVLFVILVFVVWTAFAFAPFMHNVVFGFNWDATLTVGGSLFSVATLSASWLPAQYVLAAAVFIGIITTFWHREHLWLTVAYLFFGVIFVVCASSEGIVKHFLGGFWYTDPTRLFACLVFPGIPLAALGISWLVGFLQNRLRDYKVVRSSVIALVVLAFCFFVYRPGVWIGGTYQDSAFGKMRWEFKQGNDNDRIILFDSDEQRFLGEVAAIVPENALVANLPDDGSAFAYGVCGLRTYYRDYRDYEGSAYAENHEQVETEESKLIRMAADEIAVNDEVRAAFDRLGIEYILILDYGDSFAEQPKVASYDPSLWYGIRRITDDTPGFSVVLSEGDMRLYRIDI